MQTKVSFWNVWNQFFVIFSAESEIPSMVENVNLFHCWLHNSIQFNTGRMRKKSSTKMQLNAVVVLIQSKWNRCHTFCGVRKSTKNKRDFESVSRFNKMFGIYSERNRSKRSIEWLELNWIVYCASNSFYMCRASILRNTVS